MVQHSCNQKSNTFLSSSIANTWHDRNVVLKVDVTFSKGHSSQFSQSLPTFELHDIIQLFLSSSSIHWSEELSDDPDISKHYFFCNSNQYGKSLSTFELLKMQHLCHPKINIYLLVPQWPQISNIWRPYFLF